jgi:hypothetical protein
VCPAGLIDCGGTCINPLTNPTYCGATGLCVGGVVCPTGGSCTAGVCTCPTGQTNCSGACVDTQTSLTHCGACGTVCTATGQTCSAGKCECPAGQIVCGTACVDPLTNPAYCGANPACNAFSVCSGLTPNCVAGVCSP